MAHNNFSHADLVYCASRLSNAVPGEAVWYTPGYVLFAEASNDYQNIPKSYGLSVIRKNEVHSGMLKVCFSEVICILFLLLYYDGWIDFVSGL